MEDLVTVDEACKWASDFLKKRITKSSIHYLLQYGKINKHADAHKNLLVSISELKAYYESSVISKQHDWKKQIGNDLNWHLSFDNLRELDTTKHVHRLHPYKGKYIPQLVEYFLDSHTDEFKKEIFFKPGDIVIDPFMGSGTTLVECGELGLHCIGIDISRFNCIIALVKVSRYDTKVVAEKLSGILDVVKNRIAQIGGHELLKELKERVHVFNKLHFTGNDYKKKIASKEIDEDQVGKQKIEEFFADNGAIIEKLIKIEKELKERKVETFLDAWFNTSIKEEFKIYLELIDNESDELFKNLLKIIASRTARACRSTKHFDLATLKEPQFLPYYCWKHKKICTPIESSFQRFKNYTMDTIRRIETYAKLRKDVELVPVNGDSRVIDVLKEVERQNPRLSTILSTRRIDGLFSSPPYVGQIDYHEQHAYAYEMFAIPRQDDKEIGSLSKGESNKAREDYVIGISAALRNVCKYIKDDGNIFLVANDKYDLYPAIARRSGLEIVNRFKRPVLNRTERDRQPYAEIIFHMRKKKDDDVKSEMCKKLIAKPASDEKKSGYKKVIPIKTTQSSLF
ncbi:MAG: DNA methyltransferase [Candidatus Sigynarchaeota archaeon]